ncbi:MAG: DUF1569 domain-containing protein [Rubrivivax sp.]
MTLASRRRTLAVLAAAPVALGGCASSPVQQFPDWASARRAIEGLRASPARSGTAWDLAQVLQHLAQSIEYSMSGFPELKPGWFRASVGRAAFAVFDARGRMSHGLTEPIPGAPALAEGQPLGAAADRLLKAMAAFDAVDGSLQPHFAYGVLDKPSYARAHLMHLADHWTQVIAA